MSVRPVVALDVEGVLSAPMLPQRTLVHMLPQHLPRSPFVRSGGEEEIFTSAAIKPEDADWLNDLNERTDLVWASAWEGAANTYFAPLLKLPPFEVATNSRLDGIRHGEQLLAWKARCLLHHYRDRPLIWLDLDAHVLDHSQMLAIRTDRTRGVLPKHKDAMEKFLSSL